MPLDDTEVAERLYASRRRTYRGFLHLTKWFVIHSALILLGLLLFRYQEGSSGGFILIAAGAVAMANGILTTGRVVAKPAPKPGTADRAGPLRQAAE